MTGGPLLADEDLVGESGVKGLFERRRSSEELKLETLAASSAGYIIQSYVSAGRDPLANDPP